MGTPGGHHTEMDEMIFSRTLGGPIFWGRIGKNPLPEPEHRELTCTRPSAPANWFSPFGLDALCWGRTANQNIIAKQEIGEG
jgi:hypothetical protein